MKYKVLFFLLLSLAWLMLKPTNASAQETSTPEFPTYIIQPGDTLAAVAFRFGVSLNELIRINEIQNPNVIPAGTAIILPGLEGITGVLTTFPLQLGQTLRSLSIQHQITQNELQRLNKISSITQLYQGANVIIPIKEDPPAMAVLSEIRPDQTLLELAVTQQRNIWELTEQNLKPHLWSFLPDEPVYGLDSGTTEAVFASFINNIQINPAEIMQGGTVVVTVSTNLPVTLSGSLSGNTLNFFKESENQYIAYQGIHVLTPPGLVEFSLHGVVDQNTRFTFEQTLVVSDSFFGNEKLFVDANTLNLETIQSEDQILANELREASPEKLWSAEFACVVDQPVCIRSWFGTTRDYNAGAFFGIHSGLDYGVCASFNIYSPAAGKVAYVDELIVRGKVLYIDHGWGVYSGYAHLDQVLVNEGDFVQAGDLIALMGATGRVTGTHLHFEVVVNGVHTNPLQWLGDDCR